MSPAKPALPRAIWSVSEPTFFPFDLAKNSNLSMNAPAQFQRIPALGDHRNIAMDEFAVLGEFCEIYGNGQEIAGIILCEVKQRTKRCQKRIRISNVLRVTLPHTYRK